jgi:rhomboid family GlyGly-CTERM serine protease
VTRPSGAWWWTGIGLALGLPAALGFLPSHMQPPAAWALHPSAGLHQSPLNYWTCAWLHANAQHLAANLAALALILVIGWRIKLPPLSAAAWGLAWPLTHLALLLDVRLGTYYGLSGVLHAGVAILALTLITRRGADTPPMPTIGWLLLVGLLAKCGLENPGLHATLPRPDLGMNVAPMAHWAGALVGIALKSTLNAWFGFSQSRS